MAWPQTLGRLEFVFFVIPQVTLSTSRVLPNSFKNSSCKSHSNRLRMFMKWSIRHLWRIAARKRKGFRWDQQKPVIC